jgi:hypothetical protein
MNKEMQFKAIRDVLGMPIWQQVSSIKKHTKKILNHVTVIIVSVSTCYDNLYERDNDYSVSYILRRTSRKR